MIKTSYGIHKDVYQCYTCKMGIEAADVENLIKNSVENDLKEKEPLLIGNKLAKEKQKLKDKIQNIENEITNLIILDASDEEISNKSNEIKLIQEKITKLSTNKSLIYDVNGNLLSNDDMNNFKKVAMALYKKAYLIKVDGKVNMEVIKRQKN